MSPAKRSKTFCRAFSATAAIGCFGRRDGISDTAGRPVADWRCSGGVSGRATRTRTGTVSGMGYSSDGHGAVGRRRRDRGSHRPGRRPHGPCRPHGGLPLGSRPHGSGRPHGWSARATVRKPEVSTPEPTPGLGWLKNGNRPGRFSDAPRCGARSKRTGEPCRAPACRGKRRCRFHGGKSTGPRTPEGLANSRRARRTHGAYSVETRRYLERKRAEIRLFLAHGAAFRERILGDMAALIRLQQRERRERRRRERRRRS